DRHRLYALAPLGADFAPISPAAVLSRFPFQPGSFAREFRADRLAARRSRRTRAPPRPLWQRGVELDRHHAAPEEAPVLHAKLFAGLGDLSLRDGEPGLFLRRHAARRSDANRIGLQQRADR